MEGLKHFTQKGTIATFQFWRLAEKEILRKNNMVVFLGFLSLFILTVFLFGLPIFMLYIAHKEGKDL